MEVQRRISLMGMEIDLITEGQVVAAIGESLSRGRGGWVITPNLEQLRRFRKETSLHHYYEEADLVLADGMPLVWASRLKGTPLPARVAGSDLIWSLSMEAARRGRSVFVLGGTRAAGWEAAEKLKERCPGLRIAGVVYPPHGFENDPSAMDQIVETLQVHEPDIVYVGLGFPKQERVIAQLRDRFPHTWFLGIGISIGFVGGQVARAPGWMQRMGLEWLHRLAKEPRRLASRYLLYGLPFAARLLMHGAMSRVGRGRSGEAPAELPYNRPALEAGAVHAATTERASREVTG